MKMPLVPRLTKRSSFANEKCVSRCICGQTKYVSLALPKKKLGGNSLEVNKFEEMDTNQLKEKRTTGGALVVLLCPLMCEGFL